MAVVEQLCGVWFEGGAAAAGAAATPSPAWLQAWPLVPFIPTAQHTQVSDLEWTWACVVDLVAGAFFAVELALGFHTRCAAGGTGCCCTSAGTCRVMARCAGHAAAATKLVHTMCFS